MDAPPGNRKLREMSPGKARSLCKIELRGDPAAQARYREWCDSNEDEKRGMGPSFRGCEKGGRNRSAE